MRAWRRTEFEIYAWKTLACVRSFVRSFATRARRRLTTDEWMDAWIDRGGLPHTFALASSRARARVRDGPALRSTSSSRASPPPHVSRHGARASRDVPERDRRRDRWGHTSGRSRARARGISAEERERGEPRGGAKVPRSSARARGGVGARVRASARDERAIGGRARARAVGARGGAKTIRARGERSDATGWVRG